MQSRTFSSRVFVVLASLMIVGPARTVAADTLRLMWDANPEPAVTGYIVHVGTQPGSYSATGLPAGVSLNASTGLISGSPITIGTYAVSVTVSDGSLTRSRTFTWTIRTP